MRWRGLAIFLCGIVAGGLLAYGYMWYQVYQKFNDTWTCQIFTGKLSIEEAEHCASINKQP